MYRSVSFDLRYYWRAANQNTGRRVRNINDKSQGPLNFILYLKSLKINQRNYTKVYEIVKVGAILLMFNNKE